MKLIHTVYLYGLNKEIKLMTRNTPLGKFFPPLPRFIECFIDTNGEYFLDIEDGLNYDLYDLYFSCDIKILFLNQFPCKRCRNDFHELLGSFKKKELNLLGQ